MFCSSISLFSSVIYPRVRRYRSAAIRARWKEALLAASLWTVFASCRFAAAAAAAATSCEDLLTEFRYPCTCSELSQIGGLALNCDGVVYASDHVNLPKDAPVVVFTQRNAGHHSVPVHLFPSTGESRVHSKAVAAQDELVARKVFAASV